MNLHRRRLTLLLACPFLLLPLHAVQAGWQDLLKSLDEVVGQGGQLGASSLSQEELTAGLKEALEIGTQRAVELLARDGGYLDDPKVRIPLPDSLRQIEKGLRAVGQEQLADEFIATMNRAAEQAVPEAVSIFGATIRQMSLQDARGILNGPDDAATRYLRRQSGGRIEQAFLPIVEQATTKAGVTSAYKKLVDSAGFLGSLLQSGSLDLDRYVTEKAVDGLFLKLAAEEALIRKDPLKRSTELLRKVFANVGD